MKKLLALLGILASAIVAIMTANAGLIRKKQKEIEELKEKKKELELKKAVLIDNAKDAKKKTIKSEAELDKEIKRISRAYGDNVDDLVQFIATGKRKT